MALIKSEETINGETFSILIESDVIPQSTAGHEGGRRTRDNPIAATLEQAESAFASGVSLVRHCATQVVDGIQNLDEKYKPEVVEVQLAIKLGSKAGAILVNVSGEAQMQVTLKWNLKD